jgi:hypothetical protein
MSARAGRAGTRAKTNRAKASRAKKGRAKPGRAPAMASPRDHSPIRDLIDEHLDGALPVRWRGVKVEGHDVAALDAHSVACMVVFQQGPERFGWKGCWLLQECHLALCEVVESPAVLAAGGAGEYLERARRITGLILEDRCAALSTRRRKRRWWQAA